MSDTVSVETPITEHEATQIERANASGLMPVMFVRGHALTIDHGWSDVADIALAFVRRFA